MINAEYASAFTENEKEANRYTARCMLILAGVVIAVWILNLMGIFIVPARIMAVAAAGGTTLFLLPSVLVRVLPVDSPRVKLYIMACCVLGITLLSSAMPKHAILAWAAPIALSCHYYSRRYTLGTLLASLVCMAVSIYAGIYYGEWDNNLLRGIESEMLMRVITPLHLKNALIFYILPRSMILVGVSTVCSTLSDRTHKLLERQVEDSVEKQRIESELNVATQIQTSMLPGSFHAHAHQDEIDIFASMTPAKEVGGDFYDFFMVDDRHLAIVMADVSGKGVPAALFMVIGKTLIKDHTQPDRDLGEVFSRVNDLLCESNSEGLFITAFEGVLDLVTGELRYVNAGHEPPYIYRAGGTYEPFTVKPGFVLAGMEGMGYRAGSVFLEPGDKIFQYTDGVTEATDLKEELYGWDRLTAVLNKNRDCTPAQLIAGVKEDIDRFVGKAPQFDDITMLCLEYKARMQPEAD